MTEIGTSISFSVVVPALTIRHQNGRIDTAANTHYAAQLAQTWVDAVITAGSAGEGILLTVNQRVQLLDLWLKICQPPRIIACCWKAEDVERAVERGVRPMVVLRGLRGPNDVLALLEALPPDCLIYSHPRYTEKTLDALTLAVAAKGGILPAGAKISKISVSDVRDIRKAVGPAFTLWHGSARRIAASVAAGADGVVVTALNARPQPFPAHDVMSVQRTVDAWSNSPSFAACHGAQAESGPVQPIMTDTLPTGVEDAAARRSPS